VRKTPTALNHMVVSSRRRSVDLLLSITKPNAGAHLLPEAAAERSEA
jgi:hypothetical protein